MQARARAEAEAAARARHESDAARREAEERARREQQAQVGIRQDNPNITKDAEFDRVRVFFATNRAGTGTAGAFGAGRGDAVSYGSVSISVPRTHKAGEIERPATWLHEAEDPRKHMVVVGREVNERDAFFANVRDTIRRGGRKLSFVFVPGFNVDFDDAARRTAQITYDLEFPGAPVFFSWPSQGKESAYLTDEQNAEWSVPHLKTFLAVHAKESGADDVYLIAHSLGARILAKALAALLEEQPLLRSKFKEVILTAPDIDADVFKTQLAPRLVSGVGRVTLYASAVDRALQAAKQAHARMRIGEAGPTIAVVPGVETIDASATDTSFVEAAYAGKRSVLADIKRVVVDGVRAVDRGLDEYEAAGGKFWRLDGGAAPRTQRWATEPRRRQISA